MQPPRDGLFMQDRLDLIGQLIRAEHPQVAQERRPMRKGRVTHLRRQRIIGNPVELQREEQKMRGNGGQAFIDRLREPRHVGIRRIGREQKLGIGTRTAQHFINPLVFGNSLRQFAPGTAASRPCHMREKACASSSA